MKQGNFEVMRMDMQSALKYCVKGGLVATAFTVSPVYAANVLLTNDDGLTSNVKALYEALKAEGHDVIVSVPCQGQSGMGAAIKILMPLTELTADCFNGAAREGEPGVGPMTKDGFEKDYYYVNGTPVMALLYGLDIRAIARWGKAPDIVLSGPNEGQNLGYGVISSGTVSNAQYAAIRGIASVAFSAGLDTADNRHLANPKSKQVAQLSMQIFNELQRDAEKSAVMPKGTAINVNFPDDLADPKWHYSKIGTYNAFDMRFAESLAKDPFVKQYGLAQVDYPGISVGINPATVLERQVVDEAVVNQNENGISVSVMQIAYEASEPLQKWLQQRLKGFFNAQPASSK